MEDKEIAITLKSSEWNVVLNALANRPYGEVMNVIAAMQQQASSQVNAE